MRSLRLLAPLALASTWIASPSTAQIGPQPKFTDPFDRVVEFEITKRYGSKETTSERIFMQVPRNPGAQSPVLLLFHGAYYDRYWFNYHPTTPKHLNVPIKNLMDHMTYYGGWIVVSLEGGEAPDGGNGTYAIPEMHQRVSAVLDYVDQEWGVNPNRICTLGHSMGAVDAASYAARHQDPSRWRIAGVFSWSGVLNTAPNGFAKAQWASSGWGNGGQPWMASSVVQYGNACNPGTCDQPGNYVADESLIFNMAEIPFTITRAVTDGCFAKCGIQVAQALADLPGNHLPNIVFDYAFNLEHAGYDEFDPATMLQFFNGCVLPANLPLSAHKTVAVEDVPYFYFDVTRQSLTEPAVFGWDLTVANTLTVSDTKKLSALRFRVDDPGNAGATPLDSTSDVFIDCVNTDTSLSLQLDNYQTTPSNVYLNGSIASTTDWEYDATTRILKLGPQPAGTFDWRIEP